MRENFKCYACCWFKYCDENTMKKCIGEDYVLYSTEEQKDLCDLMCPNEEEE